MDSPTVADANDSSAAPNPTTPAKREEQDPRTSLRHVLVSEDPTPTRSSPKPEAALPTLASKDSIDSRGTPTAEGTPQNDYASMTTSTRRNQSGTISSVYSGNRIRYLKKDDGYPFWRRDIQYAFLRYVFEDQTRVFTKNSDGTTGNTFAEIYVDAMAKSSRCSGVLKERLLSEAAAGATIPPAIEMAMVCLLVNVGRMNTTVNFFPEMRARVRTFHSIPCLQAHQGPAASKQLQDGPRLKSILKGALEDHVQPKTIPELMAASKPRINPVSLIFMLASSAPRISELHFPPSREFFDIFMRDTLTSKSRATAFLWLVWWYLESDYTFEDSQNNPFGPGLPGPEGELPVRVPPFETLTDEEAAKENEDPPEEIEFGEAKKKERERIMASDEPIPAGVKRGKNAGNPAPPPQRTGNVPLEPHRSRGDTSTWSERGEFATSNSRATRDSQGVLESHYLGNGPQIHGFPEVHPFSSPSHHEIHGGGVLLAPKESFDPRFIDDGADIDPHSRSAIHYRFDAARSSQADYERSELDETINDTHSQHGYSRGRTTTPTPLPTHSRVGNNHHANEADYFSTAPNGVTTHSVHTRKISPDPESRPASGHAPTAQQIRSEKVTKLLEQNLQELQSVKYRERKRRGTIIDAWIKARELPEGWNSEEDEQGRSGGIDEVVDDEVSANLKPSDANDSKSTPWSIGDAGQRIGQLASGLHRLCQLFGKREAKRGGRYLPPNGSRKRKADAILTGESRRGSHIMAPGGILGHSSAQHLHPLTPSHLAGQRARRGSHATLTNEETNSGSKSRRKSRRRAPQPQDTSNIDQAQAHGSHRKIAMSEAKAGVTPPHISVPKSRKRKGSEINATSEDIKPGERGIPRDEFFSPTSGSKGSIDKAPSGGSTSRRRKPKSSGAAGGAVDKKDAEEATGEPKVEADDDGGVVLVDREGDVDMDRPVEPPAPAEEKSEEQTALPASAPDQVTVEE